MQLSNRILTMGMTLLILLEQKSGQLFANLHRQTGRFVVRRFAKRRATGVLHPATGKSRGDVPGWVLITLMSAVLVAGLLAIAGPALERLFNQAMDQVQP